MENARLRALVFDSSTHAIALSDLNGVLIDVNHSFVKMWGYDRKAEILGRPADAFWELPRQAREAVRSVCERTGWTGELVARRKDRTLFDVHIFATTVKNEEGEPECLAASFIDTTRRAWVKRPPFKSREDYLILFEKAPASIWEQDFSEIRKHVGRLQSSGVEDFREYFETHPEDVAQCAAKVKVLDVNEHTLALYGAECKEQLLDGLPGLFTEESLIGFRENLVALTEGQTKFEVETTNRTLSGEEKHVALRWSLAPGAEDTWAKAFVCIVDITARKQKERDLHALSYRDELTGVLNRRGFFALAKGQLEAASRPKTKLELFVIDMDGLKWINDNFGHVKGDSALKNVADTLRNVFPEPGFIGRIGGDEFGAIVASPAEVNADVVAARLLSHLETFNATTDRQYALSLSMGSARYDPENPCSLDDLMGAADRAMYEQKRWKKTGYGEADGARRRPSAASSTSERRRTRRYNVRDLTIHCVPEGLSSSGPGEEHAGPQPLINFSLDGAQLLASERFEPGTPVQVRIHGSPAREPRSLSAAVVWCQQIPTHVAYRVGIEFTGPPGEKESLRELAARLATLNQ